MATVSTNPGPSPRRRGSPSPKWPPRASSGSIPAQAGEPSEYASESLSIRVHPRAGGGAPPTKTTSRRPPGPSPRRRGSRSRGRHAGRQRGSIPAQAGEPRPAEPRRSPRRVHPRAGGGAIGNTHKVPAVGGPSPRRRGSPLTQMEHRPARGSIPAQAGEPRQERGCFRYHGSIPAQAGEPPRPLGWRALFGVHPRAGGGAMFGIGAVERTRGPSPRRRGSLIKRGPRMGPVGSIPAQAGEPAARWSARRAGGSIPAQAGSHAGRPGEIGHLGSIPAQAGEPLG